MAINYIKKFLTNNDLEMLKEEIINIESKTSGEIRLCLKLKRNFREKKMSYRDLAIKEFHRLEMNKTLDKTGVLIYILFVDRVFEIIADEGINEKIGQEKWDIITNHIKTEFSGGNYKEGLIKCIKEIGEVLAKEFPIKQDDKNELPDDIIIRK